MPTYQPGRPYADQSLLIEEAQRAYRLLSALRQEVRASGTTRIDVSGAYLRSKSRAFVIQTIRDIWEKYELLVALQDESLIEDEWDKYFRIYGNGPRVPSGVTGTGPDTRWRRFDA